MESGKTSSSVSYFKMPLHYPRYTRKDYQDMPEWKLDHLLAEYGLPMQGDLAHKRESAMGAFLWPDTTVQDQDASSSLQDKKFK